MTIRESNHILARFGDNKKTAFDESYADSLYENYKNNQSGKNYYKSNIRTYTKHGNKFNMAVANAVRNLDLEVTFLTPSAYETERNEKR